jgi:hypothetical protein
MVAVFFSFQRQIATPPAQNPLSVCQVLQNLSTYRGQLIQIEGEWDGLNGTLIGDCPRLNLKGKTWPSEIQLAVPNDGSVRQEEPANWATSDFQVYLYALEGAWLQWLRIPEAEREKRSVVAVIAGRLDSRLVAPDDQMNFGYGPDLYAPARLVILHIDKLNVKIVNKRVARPFIPGPPVAR